jgi:hypothetical protein
MSLPTFAYLSDEPKESGIALSTLNAPLKSTERAIYGVDDAAKAKEKADKLFQQLDDERDEVVKKNLFSTVPAFITSAVVSATPDFLFKGTKNKLALIRIGQQKKLATCFNKEFMALQMCFGIMAPSIIADNQTSSEKELQSEFEHISNIKKIIAESTDINEPLNEDGETENICFKKWKAIELAREVGLLQEALEKLESLNDEEALKAKKAAEVFLASMMDTLTYYHDKTRSGFEFVKDKKTGKLNVTTVKTSMKDLPLDIKAARVLKRSAQVSKYLGVGIFFGATAIGLIVASGPLAPATAAALGTVAGVILGVVGIVFGVIGIIKVSEKAYKWARRHYYDKIPVSTAQMKKSVVNGSFLALSVVDIISGASSIQSALQAGTQVVAASASITSSTNTFIDKVKDFFSDARDFFSNIIDKTEAFYKTQVAFTMLRKAVSWTTTLTSKAIALKDASAGLTNAVDDIRNIGKQEIEPQAQELKTFSPKTENTKTEETVEKTKVEGDVQQQKDEQVSHAPSIAKRFSSAVISGLNSFAHIMPFFKAKTMPANLDEKATTIPQQPAKTMATKPMEPLFGIDVKVETELSAPLKSAQPFKGERLFDDKEEPPSSFTFLDGHDLLKLPDIAQEKEKPPVTPCTQGAHDIESNTSSDVSHPKPQAADLIANSLFGNSVVIGSTPGRFGVIPPINKPQTFKISEIPNPLYTTTLE